MNEMSKTLIYLACAVVALIAGVLSRPASIEVSGDDLIGQSLFERFDDPSKAASLEIIEFNEADAEKSTFKVARDPQTKLWTIPSHSKYPADADTQMRDAALALIDLKVLDLVAADASDHELYGVVDPSGDDLEASTSGVGKLAIVEDAQGATLAEIIIGKAIKDSEGQRFVRRRNEEPIYVVEINPDSFPTDFNKWIERDLLQLTSFDIESFSLRDYSVVPSVQGFLIDQRLQIDATFDSAAGSWNLNEMLTFVRGKPVPSQLLEEEELNTTKLNDVKSALDQLEIVDVVRKPLGLGADLKASSTFMDDRQNVEDLMKRGFYAFPIGADGSNVLTSANGEIHASTKDGVKYILRFGNTTGTQDAQGQLNRYLFATAEVDHSKIPKPILQPLPVASDGEAPKEETDESLQGFIREGEAEVIADPDELAAARERITKENNRKVEEYNEQKKTAEDRVRQLQQRFGDWYYVISDNVYKKIHLGRADIIQVKEGGSGQGFRLQAFRKLQEQGLEGGAEPETGAPGAPVLPPMP